MSWPDPGLPDRTWLYRGQIPTRPSNDQRSFLKGQLPHHVLRCANSCDPSRIDHNRGGGHRVHDVGWNRVTRTGGRARFCRADRVAPSAGATAAPSSACRAADNSPHLHQSLCPGCAALEINANVAPSATREDLMRTLQPFAATEPSGSFPLPLGSCRGATEEESRTISTLKKFASWSSQTVPHRTHSTQHALQHGYCLS